MELSNYNKLDECITQKYSNAVDPVTAIAEGVGKTAEAVGKAKDANARKAETESRVGCVKPSIFAGKKKKSAYKDCLSQYKKTSSNDKSLDRELELQKLRMSNENNQRTNQQTNDPTSSNKILFIVGGSILLALTIAVGVIVYKNKQ